MLAIFTKEETRQERACASREEEMGEMPVGLPWEFGQALHRLLSTPFTLTTLSDHDRDAA